MPEVPVENESWTELVLAVVRLCLNPSSFEATAHIERAWESYAMHGLLRHFQGERFEITQEQLTILSAGHADRVPLGARFGELTYGLNTAGHVLTYTLRLARHLPSLASAEAAFKIVSARYVREGLPAGLTYVRSAWRKYRPVAQYVAALDQAGAKILAMKGVVPEISAKPVDEGMNLHLGTDFMPAFKEGLKAFEARSADIRDMWATYFGAAEALRLRGERHAAPNQVSKGRTLLDPSKSWAVPTRFSVPSIALDLPDLNADERHSAAGVN